MVVSKDTSASYNYWDDISLIHTALPEIDMDEISLETEVFGKRLAAPIIIAGMTGGYSFAEKINERLGRIAEEFGIGMGVGSQRAAIENPELSPTYSVIRDMDIPLKIANIGAPQLIEQGTGRVFGPEEAKGAMDMIDADVLAIHLNYLQEVVQPEGETRAKGVLPAVRKIASSLPVIAKETGAGISRADAVQLKKAGVVGLDVGGMSGTSFSAVEMYRARDYVHRRTGETLRDWGIPTPASVHQTHDILPVTATGGLRTGLDVAKAIVIGADAGGMAASLLEPAMKGENQLRTAVDTIISELKAAMFLTGSASVGELQQKEAIVHGRLKDWI